MNTRLNLISKQNSKWMKEKKIGKNWRQCLIFHEYKYSEHRPWRVKRMLVTILYIYTTESSTYMRENCSCIGNSTKNLITIDYYWFYFSSEHYAHLYGPVAMIEDHVKPLVPTTKEQLRRASLINKDQQGELLLDPSK